jgi:hypothetical protein
LNPEHSIIELSLLPIQHLRCRDGQLWDDRI